MMSLLSAGKVRHALEHGVHTPPILHVRLSTKLGLSHLIDTLSIIPRVTHELLTNSVIRIVTLIIPVSPDRETIGRLSLPIRSGSKSSKPFWNVSRSRCGFDASIGTRQSWRVESMVHWGLCSSRRRHRDAEGDDAKKPLHDFLRFEVVTSCPMASLQPAVSL